MFRALLIAAIMCASTQASAQDAASPSAEQIETIRTRGQQILAAAGAEDFFVVEVDEPVVKLRHLRSGMLCRFSMTNDGRESVRIVPSQALGIARGDDVSCTRQVGAGTMTLFATRRPEPTTAEQELNNSTLAMQAVYQSVRPVTPRERAEVPIPEGQTLPPSLTSSFQVSHDGSTFFTRISVAAADGWILKMRFSAPEERPNVLADIFWQMTLLDFASRTSDRQQAPATETPTE